MDDRRSLSRRGVAEASGRRSPPAATLSETQPRRSGRFSAQLEFRRGLRDARQGRAPASMAEAYVAGYAQGRRAPRLRGPQAASAGAEPPSGPSLSATSFALAA